MKKWVADFETTSKKRKDFDGACYVWGVGICEVGNPDNITILKSMSEFIEWCINTKSNDTVYFHNMKFDGNFIIQWLLRNDYKFVSDYKEKASKTFTCVISDDGLWYQIEIFFLIKGSKVKKVTIRDSYKLIPLSVENIAKEFKLPIKKGHIDYSAHDFLPEGSEITEEEKDYIIKDVQIVEHAINFFHSNGMDKMTIGACAMEEFKKIIGQKHFRMYFPDPFYDSDVRETYKGGFTYLNPKFKEAEVGNMVVMDKNSMHASVMAGCNDELMPYGTPIYFDGEYVEDKNYPLYVQKIECTFDLKPNKLPTIQIKKNRYFHDNQYLITSGPEPVTLYLTSVDLKLFFDHYDVHEPEFLSGWKFMGVNGSKLFGKYIQRWTNIKIHSKENGNWGMYLIAKLMLNNLYGKFGSDTEIVNKEPFIGKDGNLHFRSGKKQEKDGIYIAVATFVTAYARENVIRAAQMIQDNYYAGNSDIEFVYADTDSLHCVSPEFKLPEGLDIHPTKLGAWDHEASAVRGKFIKQKCYIEKHIIDEKAYNKAMKDDDTIKEQYSIEDGNYYYTKITVAGMPDTCYPNVTFDNFNVGMIYPGKLAHRTVQGGVVLEDIDFTIKK
jgi:hypothetical protein